MSYFTRWIEYIYKCFSKDRPPLLPADTLNLTPGVAYWRDYLTERIIRIFEWNGLPIPQRIVETYVQLGGYAGFKFDEKQNNYICVPGSLSGVTPYPDLEFTSFVFAAPGCQGGRFELWPGNEFGSVVLISNDSMRLGTSDMIDRYAVMLAHADSTIANTLVNMRYDSFLQTDDDSRTDQLKGWRAHVTEGEILPIVDESLTGAPAVVPVNVTNKGQIALDAIDARKEIIRLFYQEIGIRIMPEKRGNMISAEVSENDDALLFNISDMLKARQQAAEQINQRFGLNVTVKLAPDFDRLTAGDVYDGDN